MSGEEDNKSPKHGETLSVSGPGGQQPKQPASERAPAVRFSSNVDEIQSPVVDVHPSSNHPLTDSSATPEQIQALTNCLEGTQLQEQRLKNYSFQPFSLPASRVPSNDTSYSATPQQSYSPMAPRSPRFGPSTSGPTPPLTPSGSTSVDQSQKSLRTRGSDSQFSSQDVTPQYSGQEVPRLGLPHRPASSDNISQRTTAVEDISPRSHRKGMFSVGGASLPVSRESSPSRPASQYYSRPFTPQGDVNDPYAASKRPAQAKNAAPGSIDQRFVFSRKKKVASPTASSSNLRANDKSDKRHSGLFSGAKNKGGDFHPTSTHASGNHSHQGSMADLRRFFKVGGGHKSKKSVSGISSPLGSQVPFGDDHGLSSKYGKIGRVLGSGAGGSVKLMKRSEDNTVFAVKEFRPRHSYETEKDYVKKLTAEFCVGSALHHGNIIETLDIVQEKGKWYEVMEYAPYDLFAIVMTGKMSKAEVNCCFLQILSGVTYLHSSGLAHRDLKLDNVVVSEHGIMKIIDFGSAHVFKYPFESEVVMATGIVGSDPYLAPEVYEERRYDPQAVDIWSLAIIFCCMSLRRFPWKIPRMTDNSYKLFAAEPTPGHDPQKLIIPSRSTGNLDEQPSRDFMADSPRSSTAAKPDSISTASSYHETEKKEVIRGPWRLLRLLPRESRHIIGRMLQIDPKKRALMSEILDEPWVSDTVICRQVGPGEVVSALDHKHILEPPAPPAPK
ncbi:kinase-like domain-containing protein [Xylariaceae sp. FL0255]|nr:kinase-like domain-containing protein [Xylariaceae sp. FL0255]